MRTFPYMDGDRLIELVEIRELDAAQMEIARLTALIQRLHRAISVRISADEPTGEERLELAHAWLEAGKMLELSAKCGQYADKTPTAKPTETD
jgi:hypothetical protein